MKGFSFIEIMISVGIAAVVLVSLFELTSKNLTAAELLKRRFIGANLAQEGIEIVANIRSNNWLKYPGVVQADLNADGTLRKWRGETQPPCSPGTDDCLANGNYIANYNSATQLTPFNPILPLSSCPGTNDCLVIDSTGYYCHQFAPGCAAGTTIFTPYHRVITISTPSGTPGTHEMIVVSTVSWVYNGDPYSVSIEERLYNWK